MCLRSGDNSLLSSTQPRLLSPLFTLCVHCVFKFLSQCVIIAICICPDSTGSHSTLLSTSPLNKLSCPLPSPVDFAGGSGEQQWFSYLLFVILSAVCVSLQTAADCNIFSFWFFFFSFCILMGWSGNSNSYMHGLSAVSRCCIHRGLFELLMFLFSHSHIFL